MKTTPQIPSLPGCTPLGLPEVAPFIQRLPSPRSGNQYVYRCPVSGKKLREGFRRYDAALGRVNADGSISTLSFHASAAVARKNLAAHRRCAAEWRAQAADPAYMAARLAEEIELERRSEVYENTDRARQHRALRRSPAYVFRTDEQIVAAATAYRAKRVAEMNQFADMREAAKVIEIRDGGAL